MVQVSGISQGCQDVLIRDALPVINGKQVLKASWSLPKTGYSSYEILIESETAGIQSLIFDT